MDVNYITYTYQGMHIFKKIFIFHPKINIYYIAILNDEMHTSNNHIVYCSTELQNYWNQQRNLSNPSNLSRLTLSH